jgi:Flp pilus assembly protein TadG
MMSLRRLLSLLRRPHPGQTMVFFALGTLVLLGGLGLALDAGYNFGQRRAMQNAADAAALAGASAVSQNKSTAYDDALAAAQQNGLTDTSLFSCNYVNNSIATVAACTAGNAPPPGLGIAGVQVTVSEQHPTFVFRALGTPTSSTSATATAQVRVVSSVDLSKAPFIVCGIDTMLNGPGNSTYSIFEPSGSYYSNGFLATREYSDPNNPSQMVQPKIQDDAYYYSYPDLSTPLSNAKEYVIHGSQITFCNDTSSSWKGENLTTSTFYLPRVGNYGPYAPPGTYDCPQSYCNDRISLTVNTGTVAQITADVAGAYGCKAGAPLNQCVVVLPIVDNSGPGGTGSGAQLALRTFGAFWINQINTNTHTGRLIKNYPFIGQSTGTWSTSYQGPVVITLIR